MEEEKSHMTTGIVLIFAALSIPFLLENCESRRDCYVARRDCEDDWGASDCTEHNDSSYQQCRYLGRSHSGFYSGRAGSYSASKGYISRGGFGSAGSRFSFHGG